MLSRFKQIRRVRESNRRIVDELYFRLVGQARQPRLFAGFGVPDTVMGRFESLAIHVFLALVRCGGEDALKPVAQDLVDRFVSDIEDSIREIGIGDVAVPKRMRRLTGMFYERVAAYDPPLRAADEAELGARLERFALADAPEGGRDARGLAAYMIETKAELDAVPTEGILGGRLFEGGQGA